jgi:hypothetical protein
MATAGIFTLITNDGKQDRMLMATELLKRRLTSIKQARAAAGLKDTTPTLLDIERTHVLFMNAHFKPFAAIGFEYHKVNPDSGGAQLGADIRFSIPQFGDFFSDMALYVKFNKMVVNHVTNTAADLALYKYCDYPGERLLQKVKFDVNGNPLDEYTSDVYNFHRQFLISPNKILSWNRLVGQEVPRNAYVVQHSPTSQPNTRTKIEVCDGFQTPKDEHPELTLMVPLLFWFNKDPRLAIPSVSIPYGQRFLNLTLARQDQLIQIVQRREGSSDAGAAFASPLSIIECSLYINNIFVNPEVHDIFIKRIGFTLIRVHRIQITRVDKENSNILLNNMKWPIESMFLAVKPTSNAATTNPKHMSQWHRFCKITEDTQPLYGLQSTIPDYAAYDTKLIEFQTAASTGSSGYVPTPLEGAAMVNHINSLDDGSALAQWVLHKFSLATIGVTFSADAAGVANVKGILNGILTNSLTTAIQNTLKANTVMVRPASAIVHNTSPTVEKFSITAHGIDIYKELPSVFFNAYTPYIYGGQNIMAPTDIGANMITFALYPGSYQPSGHVNVSRAREFYLQYWSTKVNNNSVITANDTCDLIIIASAINFLLISDGSAVLRYST